MAITSTAAKKAAENMTDKYKIDIEQINKKQFLIEGIEKKLSDDIIKLHSAFNTYKKETSETLKNHCEALQLIIDKLGLN